jgi:predicted Fe-Mo cluster-binding NifX family protein
MKICIPVQEDQQLDSREYAHFGRAPYFAIVDTETKELEIVDNSGGGHKHHSDHHTGLMASRGVEAVVCNGIGRRALAALDRAGIDVITMPERTVDDIVGAIQAGRTRRMTADEACGGGGMHQHGGGGGMHQHGGGGGMHQHGGGGGMHQHGGCGGGQAVRKSADRHRTRHGHKE